MGQGCATLTNAGFPRLVQLTETELLQFAELIYQRAGVRISPQKRLLLSNRLRRRLKQTGMTSFAEYYRHLGRLRRGDAEWDAMLQEVTTHETYLFRDDVQWNWFRKAYLPEREAAARQDRAARQLRIWSAACSTGDEAVTAACCVAAGLTDLSQWRVRILGTDIGVGAIAQAKTATFGVRAMHQTPDELRRRFFAKSASDDAWRALPILTDMLAFRRHNLMDTPVERSFDLVFLKNVLIYFDPASKAKALQNVCDALAPGGLLVAGAAEGVADLLRGYRRVEPWLFQKPATSIAHRRPTDSSASRFRFQATQS
ncbi:MAG: protein-glutamate O-methyltransferase CheR [Planctomycetaceae bacterium]|nr:protein-glutamate O-methyltransferase CheR [Planctomycetaceae bacterium]